MPNRWQVFNLVMVAVGFGVMSSIDTSTAELQQRIDMAGLLIILGGGVGIIISGRPSG